MKYKIVLLVSMLLLLLVVPTQAGIIDDITDWFRELFGFDVRISDTNYNSFNGLWIATNKNNYNCFKNLKGKVQSCQNVEIAIKNNNPETDFIEIQPEFYKDVNIEKIEFKTEDTIINSTGKEENIISWIDLTTSDTSDSKLNKKKTNKIQLKGGEEKVFRLTFLPLEKYEGKFNVIAFSEKEGKFGIDPWYNTSYGIYTEEGIHEYSDVFYHKGNYYITTGTTQLMNFTSSGTWVNNITLSCSFGAYAYGITGNDTRMWTIMHDTPTTTLYLCEHNWNGDSIKTLEIQGTDSSLRSLATNGTTIIGISESNGAGIGAWDKEFNLKFTKGLDNLCIGGSAESTRGFFYNNNNYYTLDSSNSVVCNWSKEFTNQTMDGETNRLSVFGIGNPRGFINNTNSSVSVLDKTDWFLYVLAKNETTPPPTPNITEFAPNSTAFLKLSNGSYINDGSLINYNDIDLIYLAVNYSDNNSDYEYQSNIEIIKNGVLYRKANETTNLTSTNGVLLFDEGVGSETLEDIAGNKFTLNNVDWNESTLQGKGITFDGANTYLIGDSGQIPSGASGYVTIETLINPSKINASTFLLAGIEDEWLFSLEDTGSIFLRTLGANNGGTINKLSTETWQHIMVVWDVGTGATVYVNGTYWASLGETFSDTSAESGNPLYIGKANNSGIQYGINYNGTMAFFKVYNRSFTSEEIKEHSIRYFDKEGNLTLGKSDFTYGDIINISFTPKDSKGYVGETKYIGFEIDSSFSVNDISFNSPVSEGQLVNFSINFSMDGVNLINITFNYNGTNYTNINTINDSTNYYSYNNLIVPQNISTGTVYNVSFYYIVETTGGLELSGSNNQTVYKMGIDDCSTYGTLFINYTLVDEGTQIVIDNSTYATNIETDIYISSKYNSSMNWSFHNQWTNQTNVKICIPNNVLNYSEYLITDGITKYNTNSYITEYSYYDNFNLNKTKLPQNIILYDLLTADSTSFLFNYYDQYYLGVVNAIVEVWRYYVGDGEYKLVEMAETNTEGQTRVHLVTEDEQYYFIVRKNGELLYTSEPYFALCIATPCQINLYEAGAVGSFGNFEHYDGITYNLSVYSDGDVYYKFTTDDGSTKNYSLFIKRLDAYDNYTIYSQESTTSSGIFSYNIPSSLNNYTYIIEALANGKVIAYNFVDLRTDPSELFGVTGLILTAVLVITTAMMAVSSGGVSVIIMALVGLLGAGYLHIIKLGWISFIWILVAGCIIIWKISRRRSTS